jgi:hypothetical protein
MERVRPAVRQLILTLSLTASHNLRTLHQLHALHHSIHSKFYLLGFKRSDNSCTWLSPA